jgi:transcriptional regulator with XRE-family HTH domain
VADRAVRKSKAQTKLAAARLSAGLTQKDMAEVTGMSRSAYWRLERGRIDNPPLRYLTNCAIVIGVAVDELIEDEWLSTWLQLSPDGPAGPPEPGELFRRSASNDWY